ncbi:hypothetical protein ZWY2020_029959 [Hordeum vulgare]|nr:hypothetical protein ZWY2020_029959 [Hordeum vulgare]
MECWRGSPLHARARGSVRSGACAGRRKRGRGAEDTYATGLDQTMSVSVVSALRLRGETMLAAAVGSDLTVPRSSIAISAPDFGSASTASDAVRFHRMVRLPRSEVVADMKGQMAKKEEDHKHINNKYELLVNLTRTQAAVIQNLKLKHMKEKKVHSEAMEKLELKNAELTKSEDKLTQEKLELKFQIADLLKGKEVHSEERGHLELQIAELMKGEEELKLKLKCILAILQKGTR